MCERGISVLCVLVYDLLSISEYVVVMMMSLN